MRKGPRGRAAEPALEAYEKPALTYEDQLRLLERRGLHVGNRHHALKALEQISYYRLSAYWHPFKQPDNTFETGATFEEAFFLYDFDRRLRLLTLDAIEQVEILVRSKLVYILSHAYGPFAHANSSTFLRPTRKSRHDFHAWYTEVERDTMRAREQFLEHYRGTYKGFPRVPIWMASEVMSLGKLSVMFSMMQTKDQAESAHSWGIHPKVASSWLHALTVVRNICAHHGRLWNRQLSVRPMIPRSWKELDPHSSQRVYSILCILQSFTRRNPAANGWSRSAVRLLQDLHNKPRWEEQMAIPDGWRGSQFWESSINGDDL